MLNNRLRFCHVAAPTGCADSNLIDIHTVILLLVTVASALSIISLLFPYFDVPLIILGTVVVSGGVLSLFRVGIKLPAIRFSYTAICLIAIAVLLRSDLYPHQMGGQDQGLYVNMAEVLIQNKGLNFQDTFRQNLNAGERAIYAQSAMSSVSLLKDSNSIYTIEFYPLHPIWMAISKWFFGAGLHTISLLFFSALGIIGGYYLTKEIFEDEKAAMIAAFFLSVNPVLVFFSKFPVGEIVAFAFSVNGFLFLLRSVQTPDNRVRWLYWLVALLSFNCFFYVRMQFFMYLPFFCLLLFGFLVNKNTVEHQHKTMLTIVSFIVILFLTFALSLLFYFTFQRRLFDAIVLGHILSLLNPRFIAVAVIGTLVLLVVFLPTYSPMSGISRLRGYFGNLVYRREKLVPWLLPIVLLASLPSIFHLYQHGQMHPFSFSVPTGGDIWLIRYHALYRLGLMLSPIGLIILFAVPFFRIAWTPKARLFILFLSTVWLSILLQPWVPYLYYYGRYLASEMVPYSLILLSSVISILLSSAHHVKTIGRIMFFLIGLYFLAFSIIQYNKQESEELGFYNETLKYISKRDVVLASGLSDQQYVPLRITYGLSIFPLTDPQGKPIPIPPEMLMRLGKLADSKGGRLLVLTSSQFKQDGASKLTHLTFNSRFITNGEHILQNGIHSGGSLSALFLPAHSEAGTTEYGLYQIDARKVDILLGNNCVPELNLTEGVDPVIGLYGFSIPEGHGRWSDGDHAGYKCKLPLRWSLPSKLTLELMAFTPNDHKQKIIASVNHGSDVTVILDSSNPHRKLEIPLSGLLAGVEISLELKFPNAKSPKDLGLSADSRMLGASISKITFE